MQRHLNGWHAERPDHRDVPYKGVIRRGLRLFPHPEKVDLAQASPELWPAIYDQGALGSCVFNAWSRALAYAEAKCGNGPEVMSRLHPYWHYRKDQGVLEEDSGATIRGGIKTIHKYGVPLESVWPYDVSRWKDAPSPEAEKEGEHRRVGILYLALDGKDDIIDNAARGFPTVFGTVLFESFMDRTAADPVVPMPGSNESIIGGHAMCIVGYDKKNKLYKVANSWGPGWGQDGYCFIPFDYIDACADDFWAVRRIQR